MSINIPLILTLVTLITGILAMADLLFFRARRKKAVKNYKASLTEGTTADEALVAKLQAEPKLIEFSKSFFPVLLLVLVLRSFLGEPFQIPSGSMRPTLEIGDFILVNKFSYGLRLPVLDTKIVPVGTPRTGEIMVFRFPLDPSVNYIKRVVGVPGDTIRYTEDKRLYINGERVPEVFIGYEPGSLETVSIYEERLNGVIHRIRKMSNRPAKAGEWIVPPGHYFMMGDNRDDSFDSRFWHDRNLPDNLQGMVPEAHIVGKASFIWLTWPAPKFSTAPSFSRVGPVR